MTCSDFSLYIHIPFCTPGKCDYCDFYSVTDTGAIPIFFDALLKDIEEQLLHFNVKNIPTVYIGGGTPSVPGVKFLESLLSKLKSFSCFNPVEFTIEANPESVSEDFLSVCREGGISRISLGVQTFHAPSRRAVNRAGRVPEEQLALVSRFFSDSFSADIITGLPCQTEKIVIDDIKRLLAFNPAHISLYSLTAEEGTPLYNKIKSGKIKLQKKEYADDLWLAAKTILEDTGFNHYEISAFAREGKYCLHNLRYWQMENWLGAGPSASGTVIFSGQEKENNEKYAAIRYTQKADLYSYIKNPSIHTALRENIDRTSLLKETIFMGFRCKEGPDRELFLKRFGCSLEDVIPKTLTRWKNNDKMLFLNRFLTEAFDELIFNGLKVSYPWASV